MQRIEFISDKGKIVFAKESKYLLSNCTGINEGEVERESAKYINQDGVDYLSHTYEPREVVIEGSILAKSQPEMYSLRKNLTKILNGKDGGILKYTCDSGVYFSECVPDLPQYGKKISSLMPFLVSFNLYNFYWKSLKKQSFNVFERENLLSSPFIFNTNVDSGKIMLSKRTNKADVVNSGDVNTPLVFSIICAGAGDTIKVSKNETEFLLLNYNFVEGEIITIDTENMTIESSLNANIIKYLSTDSTFFTLELGGNTISAEEINQPVVLKAEFYNRFVGV